MAIWNNWVGNQSFEPRSLVTASSEGEVRTSVAKAAATASRIRTVGTAHSFTPVVETDVLLDTSAMRGIVDVDVERRLVRALPKTTIGDFGEPLWEHGLALANQGDIDTQSIAG
ncbi:MAG: FAD-binding protein, partial [Ilumatobacteraceae bacterium]